MQCLMFIPGGKIISIKIQKHVRIQKEDWVKNTKGEMKREIGSKKRGQYPTTTKKIKGRISKIIYTPGLFRENFPFLHQLSPFEKFVRG